VFVIDPDIGMPTADAQRYFKELVSGVVSICINATVTENVVT